METIQEQVPNEGLRASLNGLLPAMATGQSRQTLPPKGSCWYCEKPLDSVRRFCGKECADSFDEEAEYTR